MSATIPSLSIPLTQLRRHDAARVGTKAAHLGELCAAGCDVPPGFALTSDAFDCFLAENRLEDPTEETVTRARIPDAVAAAILDAVAALGDVALAVRSSALAEDLAGASFAGQYETILDVRGPDAALDAVRRCWASACNARVAAYRASRAAHGAGMAVVIQQLVPAEAAGVAFTADPITGQRDRVLVASVRGLGERLVSGQVDADEWVVDGGGAICRKAVERSIDAETAGKVAALARRVEALFGSPQDVEWAVRGGQVYLLQARPITALAAPVSWEAPKGCWARNFRLGEWLGDPCTPLFATWLLERLEERLIANYVELAGVSRPASPRVFLNGWYYCTMDFIPTSPGAMLAMLARFAWKLVVNGRRALMMMPPLAKHGVDLMVDDWRTKLAPKYREAVAAARAEVEIADPARLLQLVDGLADLAGDWFTSITFVSGAAWKFELPLAKFYRDHLAPKIGGSHQRLLQGLVLPDIPDHQVQGLDWFHPTMGELARTAAPPADRHARLVADREAAEAQCHAALDPRQRATFDALLAPAQRFVPLRQEQTSELTLAWPVMRRALHRLATHLGLPPDDLFFLTQTELRAAVAGGPVPTGLAERRATWERQRRLVPPLVIGQMPPMLKQVFDEVEALRGPDADPNAAVRGLPASPGRATGVARVIRRIEDAHRLGVGEILVAPATTPAWTPLFAVAAAVVTDNGSPIAHASLVAREYGIPAVVGAANATGTLRDGEIVTVDGSSGTVSR